MLSVLRKPEILLALAVAIVALLLALPLYGRVEAREKRALPNFKFERGEFFRSILIDGECIGNLAFTFQEKGEGHDGDFSASLMFRDAVRQETVTGEGSTFNLTMTGQASFNALDQLIGAVLIVESPELSLRGVVGLTESNPITVTTRVNSPKINFERKVLIPGPLSLLHYPEGSFGLQYRHQQDSFANLGVIAQQPLIEEFRQRIEFLPEELAKCESRPARALDLSSIMPEKIFRDLLSLRERTLVTEGIDD